MCRVCGFAVLIICALTKGGIAANKRPFPSSTEAPPPTKQTCLCTHESNSVGGNTSRDVSVAPPIDVPVVAVGNDAHGSEATEELNSNSFAEVQLAASASDEVSKRRRELRQLVVSLSNGRVSDENADIAVKALEESLEADGSTPEGHHWLLGVLHGLIDISKKRAEGRTRDQWKFETEPWTLLEKACTDSASQSSLRIWRSIFGGYPVNVVLHKLATVYVEQMITAIASEVSGVLVHNGIPSSGAHQQYIGVPLYSLKSAFGFFQTEPLERSFLCTAKGRHGLDSILNFVNSNMRLRFQVQAVSQIDQDEKYRKYSRILEHYWDGIFFGPEFDDLEAGRAFRRNPKEYRRNALQAKCHKFLTLIPQTTLDALVAECVRDLHGLTRTVTEMVGLDLPSSADEAQYFLAALVESFPGLTPATLNDIGGYAGLYRRVFIELRKPRFQMKVFHIRTLPFTLWSEEWAELLLTDSVDCVRSELESQWFSRFFDDGQSKEAQ